MKTVQNSITLSLIIIYCACALTCGDGYGQIPCLYLPAKPGHIPSCATPGSTFCEKIDGYPTTLIKSLLKRNGIKDFLTDETKTNYTGKTRSYYNHHDEYDPMSGARRGHFHSPQGGKHHGFHHSNQGAPTNFPPSKSHGMNYGNYFQRSSRRLDSDDNKDDFPPASDEYFGFFQPRNKRQISPSREQLCEIRTNYINPQAALNSKGNWMYIVNGVEAARQLVRTETCASTQCSNLCQLPNNYNSRCEQKYIQKRLISLDSRGEKLYNDLFWFPSCCVCTLSNNF